MKPKAKVEEEKMFRCSFCDGEIKNECDSCGGELETEEGEGIGDLPYRRQTFWCVTNVGHHCGDCMESGHFEKDEVDSP